MALKLSSSFLPRYLVVCLDKLLSWKYTYDTVIFWLTNHLENIYRWRREDQIPKLPECDVGVIDTREEEMFLDCRFHWK